MTSKGRPRSREYNLQPNLNPTQFAQGTLFSGGPRAGRNHRGYTAERITEVRSRLAAFGPRVHMGTEDQGRENRGRRAAYETVARSTIPVSEMPFAQVYVKHPALYEAHGWNGGEWGARGGEYRTLPGGGHQIEVREDSVHDDTSGTVVHELGHARSKELGTDSSQYRTPEQQGREEAFADNFMMRHQRDRRGNAPFARDYHATGRGAGFHEAYLAAREGRVDASNEMFARMDADEKLASANPTLPGLERAGSSFGHEHPLVKANRKAWQHANAQEAAAQRKQWRKG